jgi:hypothetical protein
MVLLLVGMIQVCTALAAFIERPPVNRKGTNFPSSCPTLLPRRNLCKIAHCEPHRSQQSVIRYWPASKAWEDSIHITRRLGSKFGPAARGTEVIGAVLVPLAMRCRRWVDSHAADRISLGFVGNGCRRAMTGAAKVLVSKPPFVPVSLHVGEPLVHGHDVILLDGGSIKFRRQRA